jgi:hypothetical protein
MDLILTRHRMRDPNNPNPKLVFIRATVKNPVLPHGASSKEKAIWAIHPRSSGRGILAFSRKAFYSVPAIVVDKDARKKRPLTRHPVLRFLQTR